MTPHVMFETRSCACNRRAGPLLMGVHRATCCTLACSLPHTCAPLRRGQCCSQVCMGILGAFSPWPWAVLTLVRPNTASSFMPQVVSCPMLRPAACTILPLAPCTMLPMASCSRLMSLCLITPCLSHHLLALRRTLARAVWGRVVNPPCMASVCRAPCLALLFMATCMVCRTRMVCMQPACPTDCHKLAPQLCRLFLPTERGRGVSSPVMPSQMVTPWEHDLWASCPVFPARLRRRAGGSTSGKHILPAPSLLQVPPRVSRWQRR